MNRPRRRLLCAASLAALLPHAGRARAAAANPDSGDVLATLTGGAPLRESRVTLELPVLADNGHVVPLRVSVTSPMSADDHVRAIHVIAEKNPRPHVATFHLGPYCARAEVVTRIRLAATQRVLAIATMSDGSHWMAAAEVVVTENACLDES